jgi:hypothetical protein
MKDWQFNVLFFVGVGGALLLLLGPEFGLKIGQNPTAITGVGAILTYILTQKRSMTKNGHNKPKVKPKEDEDRKEATDGES